MNDTTHGRVTTVGGALTILFANIRDSDVIKTIVLAIIGALVSFMMSVLFRAMIKWWRNRKV